MKSPENSQKLIKSRQLIFIRRENRFFDIFPNLQKRMIISWLSFLLLEVYGSRSRSCKNWWYFQVFSFSKYIKIISELVLFFFLSYMVGYILRHTFKSLEKNMSKYVSSISSDCEINWYKKITKVKIKHLSFTI